MLEGSEVVDAPAGADDDALGGGKDAVCTGAGEEVTGACALAEEGIPDGPAESKSAISGSVTIRDTTMRYRSNSLTLQDRHVRWVVK